MAASMGCSPDVDTGLPAGPFDSTPAPRAGGMAHQATIQFQRLEAGHRAAQKAVYAQIMITFKCPAVVLHCNRTNPLKDP